MLTRLIQAAAITSVLYLIMGMSKSPTAQPFSVGSSEPLFAQTESFPYQLARVIDIYR
jgi:hypothetical protein